MGSLALQKQLTFAVALCFAAFFAASLGLFYVLMSLTQVTVLLEALFPPTPEHPSNGLRQLIASMVHDLVGGETPIHMNQSAFAAAALLCSLVVLLIVVEEALMRAKAKVRAWGKLPSVEVLHHYNRNSYDLALANLGKGFTRKKPM